MFPGCRALTFQESDLMTPGLGLLLGYLVYSELSGTEAGDTGPTEHPFERQLAFFIAFLPLLSTNKNLPGLKPAQWQLFSLCIVSSSP